MSIPEVIATIIGSLGLLLSILNYWHQRVTTRPRIIVRPRVYNMARNDTGEIIATNVAVMEICNVGHVPVVGSTIGFLARWDRIHTVMKFLPKRVRTFVAGFMKGREKTMRSIIPKPEPVSGHTWTCEMKPQNVALLRFSLDGFSDTEKLGRAFASTVVGDTFKASRRDMRIFAEQLKALSPPTSAA